LSVAGLDVSAPVCRCVAAAVRGPLCVRLLRAVCGSSTPPLVPKPMGTASCIFLLGPGAAYAAVSAAARRELSWLRCVRGPLLDDRPPRAVLLPTPPRAVAPPPTLY